MSGFEIPTPEQVMALSPEQRAAAAAVLLAGLEAGRQPLALFEQLARLSVASCFEAVPLRTNSETQATEVLLTQRSDKDPWWPRQWHIPGVNVLDSDLGPENSEYGYEVVTGRLYRGELAGAVQIIGETELFHARLRRGVRGSEQVVVHWAQIEQVADLPPDAAFYDVRTVVENPPDGGLVQGHGMTITMAANAYEARLATDAKWYVAL